MPAPKKRMPPIHPGEVLREDFLAELGITEYRAAKDMAIPALRINRIVKGKRAITPDTALRLGRYFGTSAEFWINLQAHYDLECARDRLEARIVREVKLRPAA